jgi:hypothetical protein
MSIVTAKSRFRDKLLIFSDAEIGVTRGEDGCGCPARFLGGAWCEQRMRRFMLRFRVIAEKYLKFYE